MLEEITLPDGSTRRLGNLMPDPNRTKVSAFPVFGETPQAKVIPRDQWDKLLAGYSDLGPDDPFVPPVHDQNGVGCCNCSTTTALAEYLRVRQGLPYVKLSAADLYDRINFGRDAGSLLEDALEEMLKNGVGTVNTCGYLWKSGQFKGPASAAERARFRFLEVYVCPTFDHCMSAVLQGFAVNTGVMWYDNYQPDSDGWLPPGGGGAGGHSIFGYKPTKRGNRYGIWHQNSWGANWPKAGAGGRFVIPESAYTGPVGGWFAVRAIVDEGGVIPKEAA